MSTYLTIWVLIHICITHGKNRLDLNINWSSGDLSQYKVSLIQLVKTIVSY